MAAKPRFIIDTVLKDPNAGMNRQIANSVLAEHLAAAVTKEDIHHLKNVLRISIGDEIELLERRTCALYSCKVLALASDISLELHGVAELGSGEHGPTLIVALTKPALAATMVEKCTEIGVRSLVLYHADRSNRIPRDSSGSEVIAGRLRRVVDAAVKQCRSRIIPEVAIYHSLLQALESQESTINGSNSGKLLCLAPWERLPHHQPLTMLNYLIPNTIPSPKSHSSIESTVKTDDLYIVIGPEGGLTTEEINLAERFNYQPVSLGAQTLRVDTAAMSACLLYQVAQSNR